MRRAIDLPPATEDQKSLNRSVNRYFGKAKRHFVEPLLIPTAVISLRRARRSASSIEEVVDLAYDFNHHGIDIAPWQVRSEFEQLLAHLLERNPRVVVEIGTSGGGSLFLLTEAASDTALLISIDLPHGQFGGGYPRWRAPLYRSFARDQQLVRLIRGDSHNETTFERLRSVLGNRSIDFLFIDGDHRYAGVRRDFEMYSTLVASDGVVAFHDIVPNKEGVGVSSFGSPNPCAGEVPDYWRELRERYRTGEFVADWKQGSFGIGILHNPRSGSEDVIRTRAVGMS
jgi:predicted O-methyltransferase YrrM